jgi:hypothetical protein
LGQVAAHHLPSIVTKIVASYFACDNMYKMESKHYLLNFSFIQYLLLLAINIACDLSKATKWILVTNVACDKNLVAKTSKKYVFFF